MLDETLLGRHVRLSAKYYSPDEVIVVASYMKERIEGFLSSIRVDAVVVDQKGEKGTGHAIRTALEYAEADEALIVYSDIYVSETVYERIAYAEAPAVLAVETDTPWEMGVFELDREGLVRGIVEKPPRGQEPSNLAFAGVIKLERSHTGYFENLPLSPRGEYEATDALSRIAAREGLNIVQLEDGEVWIDVGRPWDLLDANAAALEERLSREGPLVRGEVHATAVITGPVIIEEGARVMAHTVIEGPAYIGRGAVVGPHAYVRPRSVILDGSKAGHSTEVKASIMMEGSKAPHLSYIGDSIIGEYVNLGAGTITANLRFDGKPVKMTLKGRRVNTGRKKLGTVMGGYAQTGINVSILPGVKIGSRALVYPGCVVARDVPKGGVYRCGHPT